MLEVSNLDVAYGQSNVIKDMSMSTSNSETLAIMGRNGMGKTTLFKSLIGILPTNTGQIKLDGQDISKFPPHKRVDSGIAYVP